MSNSTRNKISVVIITQNEEGKIRNAINSSKKIADEIVVVDGGSTDNTITIAKDLGCEVYSNPWPGYAKQRNFGANVAENNWIFFIDSDEEINEELQISLLNWKKTNENLVNAYSVYRIGDFLGKWMGKGEYLIRLYNKDKIKIKDVLVHEGPDVDANEVSVLEGVLWHHGFRSINDHVQRFNKYTDLEAEKDYCNNRRFSLLRLLLRPPAKLLYILVFRGLITKGIAGISVSFFWMYYEFLREIKLYELSKDSKKIKIPRSLQNGKRIDQER
ncbi:glycosyltransferase family 2 protein [Paenibacillus glacialis]|uniref:Glycosyl transferase n=1 Tax=Paenibacillus glacialis TaxID=494026 RepID=A0A168NYK2_9BACL|nr:glycosyltransferase family 2 protein [Paenibacillus glacialis]OAB46223.1 glycosyl transferase [Paenibacillus glacialis]